MGSENKEAVINLNINLFMQNYLNLNPQFLTNMRGTIKSIIKYLEGDLDGNRELGKLVRLCNEKLDKMYYRPIEYILEDTKLAKQFNKSLIEKLPKEFHLSNIEWIIYRDTHFKTKLKKKYEGSRSWRAAQEKISFADAIKISSQIKQDMYDILIQLLQNFKMGNLNIILPQLKEEMREHDR